MMANKKIKYRFYKSDGQTEFKMLIIYPMETGKRRDRKTRQLIPANYIDSIRFYLNQRHILSMKMGVQISKTAFISFDVTRIEVGDDLWIEWVDNHGNKDSYQSIVHAGVIKAAVKK